MGYFFLFSLFVPRLVVVVLTISYVDRSNTYFHLMVAAQQAYAFRGAHFIFWGAYAPHMHPKEKGAPMQEHVSIHSRNQLCLFAW